jgi:hypothetical protein
MGIVGSVSSVSDESEHEKNNIGARSAILPIRLGYESLNVIFHKDIKILDINKLKQLGDCWLY